MKRLLFLTAVTLLGLASRANAQNSVFTAYSGDAHYYALWPNNLVNGETSNNGQDVAAYGICYQPQGSAGRLIYLGMQFYCGCPNGCQNEIDVYAQGQYNNGYYIGGIESDVFAWSPSGNVSQGTYKYWRDCGQVARGQPGFWIYYAQGPCY